MKTKTIILAIALIIGAKCFAQLGTPLSQFSGNQLLFNPGYAGINDIFAVNLSVKKSWIGIPASPNSVSVNGHTPFQNQRHAWGWILQRSEWGNLVGNSVYGNYAHKVYFNKSYLSFGLQVGLMNYCVDWDKIDYVEDWDDPTMQTGRVHSTDFDVNVGAFFKASKWYAGFSVLHLTTPKHDKINLNDKEWFSQMYNQFFLIGGCFFAINDVWSFRPETFVRYVPTCPLSINAGAYLHYTNIFGVGVNYKTGQKAVNFTVRFNLSENLRIGYTYGASYGNIKPHQQGSHELSISYSTRLRY